MGSFEEIAVEILPLQERKEMDDFDGLDNHLDALLHHQTSRKPQVLLESGSETSHVTSFSSARNSDDEDLLIQPRGRLAARMVAEDSETEQQPKESARDRVRRMLMSKANTARMSLSEAKDTQSEDEDVPVPSRRRKAIASKASTPRSSPPKRGGLFVSPSPEKSNAHAADSDSDSDLPADVPAMTANERFMALVEKKRQERLAKEEKEQREKKEAAQKRLKQAAQYSRILEDDDLSGSEEDDGGRRLTQQARPTRKASKKALEDMHRETQRMARNMQLAHQPKTKKKITKSSLFAKFNYKPEGFMEDGVADSAPSSSPRRTDPEIHDTPPTSPSSPPPYDKVPEIESQQPQQPEESRLDDDDDDELPSLEDVTSGEYKAPSPPRTIIDKGKGKAIEQPSPPAKQPLFTQRPIRVIPPKVIKKPAFIGDDSDSDLEIIPKSKKDTIFDRIPQQQDQQSHSLHTLRMLAHLTSPGKQAPKKNARSSMTASELQLSLQQRARQQAAREREERLHDLKARGIIVQTAEERNNEMAEVEDLMAKARREADEIAKEEKAAGKKERQANGEEMFDDSSADEDYEEIDHLSKSSQAGSENGDESDDSEREDEFDEEELEDSESVDRYLTVANPLFGQDASESETAEDDQDMIMDEDAGGMINDEEELPMVQNRRRAKNVISDDEDDDLPAHSPTNLHTDSPAKTASAPGSVLRSAKKTFIPGLPVAGPAGLSLTQIFAGTMDESQDFDNGSTQSPSQRIDTEQDSLAFLRNFPAPDLPSFRPTMDEDSQDFMVDRIPESQPTQAETQGIQLSFSQSQVHGFDSLVESASQFSEFPEATQDLGFQYMSPIQGRFAAPPQSTVDTVLLQNSPTPESNQETPIVKKKGKLMRRLQAPVLSDDEEPEQAEAEREDEFEITANVFDVMRKASKKKTAVADDFDKKKSAAKEMVQEQADESEDEYAGLGGASDDESGEEDDALVREMIDDNTKNVDESKLAAFYANRERAADAAQVEKLFKDITTGTLRRKRGADYSLSDSDDDGEARRRMKRRDFAKMRKALLEDERIGKIAENPKRAAFLRAIEDRGSDDEMDWLDDTVVGVDEAVGGSQALSREDSQQEGEVLVVPDSQGESGEVMGPPKRKAGVEHTARLPPNLRRTAAPESKRPSSLSEVRASLSSLIEDPNTIVVPNDSESESEAEHNDDNDDEIDGLDVTKGKSKGKENFDPFARRNTTKVVDRISLAHNRSSSSNTNSASTRLAFAVSSAASSFKVPALLRRATTNSSITSSGSSSGGAGKNSVGGNGGGGAKRGSVGGVRFFEREEQKMKSVVEGQKKREEKLLKGVEARRRNVGGLFGKGKFE